jgi:integrative and conjugative element protein (TIGR02256 family)
MLNLASQEVAGLGDEAVAFFVAQPKVVDSKIDERPLVREAWPADITFDMDYEVRLSLSAWKTIMAEIRRNRRTRGRSVETGGILFGKRDDTLRIVWADVAVGPPPDSRHSDVEFTCGVEGVAQMHESLKKQSRGSVEFVGMWHTHPEDVPLPSTQDVRGMIKVLTLGNPPPKKCLLVIVGLTTKQPVLGAGVFERQTTPSGLEFIETRVQTRTLDREKL